MVPSEPKQLAPGLLKGGGRHLSPRVTQDGGMVEGGPPLGVLLVHIGCVLEQELTGDQRPLQANNSITTL